MLFLTFLIGCKLIGDAEEVFSMMMPFYEMDFKETPKVALAFRSVGVAFLALFVTDIAQLNFGRPEQ